MKLLSLKFPALTPVLIIIVGVAIRLININQPLLEFFPPRQTQTAEITRNIYVNGWPDFWTPKVRYFTPPQAGQAGEPIPYVLEFPLYNGIVSGLYHLFGPNVIWGRLVSLAFFVLSAITFYKLIQSTINNQQLTIFASLFFVFSPLHILTSRSFQPEELALFLLLLAIYKKSWVIFSLAVLTKLPLAFFAPAVFFYPSLRGAKRRGNLNDIIKCGLSLLPSVLWYSRASRLTIHPAIARNFDITNWFQPGLWLNRNWYFSIFQIEHIWVLTTLGLLFFWLGFWLIVAERRLLTVRQGVSLFDTKFWLVWLTSGLLYLFIFNYHAMTHEYYHLFFLPPLSVFVAAGLKKILGTVKPLTLNFRLIAISGILLLFILGLIQPAIKKIISAPKSPEESTEITLDRYRLIEDF